MGYHIGSLAVLLLSLTTSVAYEVRTGRSLNHGHFVCSAWGNFHYKTFDGDVYQFPGTCSYNLASDCRDGYQDFSVHVQRSTKDGQTLIDKIIITVKDIIIQLKSNLVVVNGEIVRTPYYTFGVLIHKNIDYIKVYTKAGLTLMWNQEDAVMLELDPKFNNQTCGLCGDYNGVPLYDEFVSEGMTLNAIQFGRQQNINDPNDHCNDPLQALLPDNTQCFKHRSVCEDHLGHSAFEDCHAIVDPESYIQTCMLDMCSGSESQIDSCVCSTITEYSRQCSHAGGRPGIWRTDNFCAKQCPDNMIYQESASPCMSSCSHQQIHSLCEEHYMDGCFCPEGTVKDDLTDKGCIQVTDCHCKHRGVVFAPGETMQNDCDECRCISGRWECTDRACPGVCSIEGGAHFTTFDGKSYTFHGDCFYVLSKGGSEDNHIILGELTPCSSNDRETCLKSVALVTNNKNNVFIFKADGGVYLNEFKITLPHVTGNFSFVKVLDSHIIVQSKFGLQIQIQLIPVMQLYITVGKSERRHVQGLCGDFNSKEGDDFKTSGGLVEATASAFANTWKAQASCHDKSDVIDDPCSISIESKLYADHWCSLLEAQDSAFVKCHSTIDPAKYAKRCRYDTCNCKNSEACMCAAVASYVKACATKGIFLIGWRENMCNKESKSCPSSQVYVYNLKTCQATCRSLAVGEPSCMDIMNPLEGCGCPADQYLNEYEECVPKFKCSCYFHGIYFKPQEIYHLENTVCTCFNGVMSCFTQVNKNCSNGKVYHDCNNPGVSETVVHRSCQIQSVDYFQTGCVSGCVCPDKLLDDGAGGCVPEERCPCVHNGNIFDHGSHVKVDCNTCLCQRGRWTCTDTVCYGTCTIYGSGHYITFDNKYYDFDGNCEFVAAQDYCGVHGTAHDGFRVITENIPCGTTGTTCSKSIKVFLGNIELKLADKHLEESVVGEDHGHHIKYLTREVGIYLVIEANNGILLIWDRKTTIFIKVSPAYKGNVCGLCGNFDDNANNDFTTSQMLLVTNVLEFGNSWKSNSLCPDVTEEVHPCSLTPHRKAWAEKQCGLLKSDVFAVCHSKVDPTPFYEACVNDACSCDTGGDCECFCTAVAVYAQACTKAEACIHWRTPDICPIFCDYYNPKDECEWHYHPCGNHSMQTCRSINNVYTNITVTYLEGCYPTCPPEKPIYDESKKICVTKEECGCYVNDSHYEIGENVPSDENCHSCECTSNGTVDCVYDQSACYCIVNGTRYEEGDIIHTGEHSGVCYVVYCINGTEKLEINLCATTTAATTTSAITSTQTGPTTTEKTSTPTTLSSSTCIYELICEWTQWYDVSKPEKDPDSGDFETYDEIRKHHAFCRAPDKIQCRAAAAPDVSLDEIGQTVHCNLSYGFICRNNEQKQADSLWQICYNYEIRVDCCEWGCAHPTTLPPSTTTTTQTTTSSPTTPPSTTTETTTSSPTTPPSTTTTTQTTTSSPTTPPSTTTETTTSSPTTSPIVTTTPELTTTVITTSPIVTSTPESTTTVITTSPIVTTTPELTTTVITTSPIVTSTPELTTTVITTSPIVTTTPESTTTVITSSPIVTSTPESTTTVITSSPIVTSTPESTTTVITSSPIVTSTPESTTTVITSSPIVTSTPESTTTVITTSPIVTSTPELTTTVITSSPTVTHTPETTSTTPEVTTITTETTTTVTPPTGPCAPTCWWTDWFDESYPEYGKEGGDYETYENIKNAGHTLCDKPENISCRAERFPDEPLDQLGQVVTCDVSTGLICHNKDQTGFLPVCYNYQISVYCCDYDCSTTVPQSTTTSTTQSTTTTTTASTTTEITQSTTTPETTTSTTLSTTPPLSSTTTTETTTSPTTTPESTTPTSTVSTSPTSKYFPTGPCAPTCWWTDWFDESYPEYGKEGGDYETYENIKNAGHTLCDKPENISCRAERFPDEPLDQLGQVVTCDVSTGLICHNKDQTGFLPVCYNYQISVYCCNYDCSTTVPQSTATSTTQSTTTTTTASTTTEITQSTTTPETTTSTTLSTTPPLSSTTTTETTTSPTTTPELTTPTSTLSTSPTSSKSPCAPTCWWTDWFDESYPEYGKEGGDYETYENIKNAGHTLCDKPENISCRAERFPDEPLDQLGQVVTCDVSTGLICHNKDQTGFLPVCYNYQISVYCCNYDCSTTVPQSTATSTTQSTTTTSTTSTTTEITQSTTTPETTTSTTLSTTPPLSSTTTTETTTSPTTTPKPTTPTSTLSTSPTSSPCAPTCWWTDWFDESYPEYGKEGGDYETYENIKNAGHTLCDKPENISCRAERFPDEPLDQLGQVVTCDVSTGLICHNKDQTGFLPVCYNYQISVYCCNYDCSTTVPQSTATSTTQSTTTTTTASTTTEITQSTTTPETTTSTTLSTTPPLSSTTTTETTTTPTTTPEPTTPTSTVSTSPTPAFVTPIIYTPTRSTVTGIGQDFSGSTTFKPSTTEVTTTTSNTTTTKTTTIVTPSETPVISTTSEKTTTSPTTTAATTTIVTPSETPVISTTTEATTTTEVTTTTSPTTTTETTTIVTPSETPASSTTTTEATTTTEVTSTTSPTTTTETTTIVTPSETPASSTTTTEATTTTEVTTTTSPTTTTETTTIVTPSETPASSTTTTEATTTTEVTSTTSPTTTTQPTTIVTPSETPVTQTTSETTTTSPTTTTETTTRVTPSETPESSTTTEETTTIEVTTTISPSTKTETTTIVTTSETPTSSSTTEATTTTEVTTITSPTTTTETTTIVTPSETPTSSTTTEATTTTEVTTSPTTTTETTTIVTPSETPVISTTSETTATSPTTTAETTTIVTPSETPASPTTEATTTTEVTTSPTTTTETTTIGTPSETPVSSSTTTEATTTTEVTTTTSPTTTTIVTPSETPESSTTEETKTTEVTTTTSPTTTTKPTTIVTPSETPVTQTTSETTTTSPTTITETTTIVTPSETPTSSTTEATTTTEVTTSPTTTTETTTIVTPSETPESSTTTTEATSTTGVTTTTSPTTTTIVTPSETPESSTTTTEATTTTEVTTTTSPTTTTIVTPSETPESSTTEATTTTEVTTTTSPTTTTIVTPSETPEPSTTTTEATSTTEVTTTTSPTSTTIVTPSETPESSTTTTEATSTTEVTTTTSPTTTTIVTPSETPESSTTTTEATTTTQVPTTTSPTTTTIVTPSETPESSTTTEATTTTEVPTTTSPTTTTTVTPSETPESSTTTEATSTTEVPTTTSPTTTTIVTPSETPESSTTTTTEATTTTQVPTTTSPTTTTIVTPSETPESSTATTEATSTTEVTTTTSPTTTTIVTPSGTPGSSTTSEKTTTFPTTTAETTTIVTPSETPASSTTTTEASTTTEVTTTTSPTTTAATTTIVTPSETPVISTTTEATTTTEVTTTTSPTTTTETTTIVTPSETPASSTTTTEATTTTEVTSTTSPTTTTQPTTTVTPSETPVTQTTSETTTTSPTTTTETTTRVTPSETPESSTTTEETTTIEVTTTISPSTTTETTTIVTTSETPTSSSTTEATSTTEVTTTTSPTTTTIVTPSETPESSTTTTEATTTTQVTTTTSPTTTTIVTPSETTESTTEATSTTEVTTTSSPTTTNIVTPSETPESSTTTEATTTTQVTTTTSPTTTTIVTPSETPESSTTTTEATTTTEVTTTSSPTTTTEPTTIVTPSETPVTQTTSETTTTSPTTTTETTTIVSPSETPTSSTTTEATITTEVTTTTSPTTTTIVTPSETPESSTTTEATTTTQVTNTTSPTTTTIVTPSETQESLTTTEATTTTEVTTTTSPTTTTTVTPSGTPESSTTTEETTTTEVTTTTSPTTTTESTTIVTPSETPVTQTETSQTTTSSPTTIVTPSETPTFSTTTEATTTTEVTTSPTTTSEITTRVTPSETPTFSTTTEATTTTEVTTTTSPTTTTIVTPSETPESSTTTTTEATTTTQVTTTTSPTTTTETTTIMTPSETPVISTTSETTTTSTPTTPAETTTIYTPTETLTTPMSTTSTEIPSPTTTSVTLTTTQTPTTTTCTTEETPETTPTSPPTATTTLTSSVTTTTRSSTTKETPPPSESTLSETTIYSSTICSCVHEDKPYPPGEITSGILHESYCYIVTCTSDCNIEIKHWYCGSSTTEGKSTSTPASTTTPQTTSTPESTSTPKTTTTPQTTSPPETTTKASTTSITTKQSTIPTTPKLPGCPFEPNREHNETWMLCNCTMARCLENNTVEIIELKCEPPPIITCANGHPPIAVPDDDLCCWHWECDCVCTGWGDPHYVTFDGTYYSYQGNCTYVLVEEIIKNVDNFGVYIDNYDCGARDRVSCPRNIIVRHETQTIQIAVKNLATLSLQVIVNGQIVATPYKKYGVKVYASGINYVVEIPELEANITYNGLAFSVKLPYRLFGHNTQGQCGTCTNNRKDDCMLRNGDIISNCEIMADSWAVSDPNKPQCSGNLKPTVPPKITVPTTPCVASKLCELIKGETFKKCHNTLRPDDYYEACVFDSCHVPDTNIECTSVQHYALLCADQGVCVDWRRQAPECPLTCPSHLVYHACGPAISQSCQTTPEEETQIKDSKRMVEGCFCPQGTMPFSGAMDVCVKHCGCVGPDNIPREFGESFQFDCQDCVCREGGSGIICTKHECKKMEDVHCKLDGFYPVIQPSSSDSCCNETACKCDTSLCPKNSPNCGLGHELTGEIPEGHCCPVYECVRKNVCVHGNAEYLPGSPVYSDNCQSCVCPQTADAILGLQVKCTHVPCNVQCPEGFALTQEKNDCCGVCVQTHCVFNHGAVNKLLKPGDILHAENDNCTLYSCTVIKNQFITSVSQISCPFFDEDNCEPDTIQLLPNGCCKICIEKSTSCKLDQYYDYISHNNCRSADMVKMSRCEGSCSTFSMYSAQARSMSHKCTCCQEVRTSQKHVLLQCTDGSLVDHEYINADQCDCIHTDCGQATVQEDELPTRARRALRKRRQLHGGV
ncbi:mucin-2 [Pelodytes ibericus]